MDVQRIPPGPGQESVWDYPRPPRLERSSRHIQVTFHGVIVAETRNAWRMLETSHPPVYYIPPADLRQNYLRPSLRSSFCEWKGRASYLTIEVDGREAPDAGWFYPSPSRIFIPIRDHVAFYAHRVDACHVDGEPVQPQPGDFYGGWITSHVVGPFKGAAGTMGW